MSQYILDKNHRPYPIRDLARWASWWEKPENRIVAQTSIGKATVSTVFLGINHEYDPDRPPILFETMVFGGISDGLTRRYHSWDEAVKGHEEVVAEVRAEG